jgi:hypothetical protein
MYLNVFNCIARSKGDEAMALVSFFQTPDERQFAQHNPSSNHRNLKVILRQSIDMKAIHTTHLFESLCQL